MKDVKKIMQAIDSMLADERGSRSGKMDSIICFGGNTDGAACLIHGNVGMLQAAIVSEMIKEEAIAAIILQASAAFNAIKEKPKKKIVS